MIYAWHFECPNHGTQEPTTREGVAWLECPVCGQHLRTVVDQAPGAGARRDPRREDLQPDPRQGGPL